MKKILSTGLALIMLVTLMLSQSIAVLAESASIFTVKFSTQLKEVKAGSTFDINFSVYSSAYLEEATASVNYSAETFLPIDLNTVKNLGSIDSGSGKNLSMRINTYSKMKTGYYPLTLIFYGKDYDNVEYTGTYTTYISVVNESADEQADPSVTIDKFSSPTSTVTAGNEFDLTFSMVNSGGQTAKDINVQIMNLSSDTFAPTQLETVEKVGDLASKKSATTTIRLKSSESLKTGSHPIEIGYTYINSEGVAIEGKYTTYISINNPTKPEDSDETTTSTPRIILENYSVDVDSIVAGKPFNFVFALKNTSTATSIGNMKVTIESADGIFTAVQGSSSFYTQTLGIGKVEQYAIDLLPKSGVEAKSYPIKILIDYEDSKGTAYSSSETINLQVTQPVRFEVSNFVFPTESYGSNPCFISFRYYNKSKTALSNFSISVEGDFTLEAGEEYIGSFAANSYDEYESMMYPSGMGTLNGVLVFKYEDAAGNEQRIEEPFTIEVFEEEPYIPSEGDIIVDPDKPLDPGLEEEGGMAGWQIALIIAGGCAVVAVVVVIIVKKKKKSKLDDDFDDEE
ncbi:MAG: hypothetical protein WC900_03920 [Oscillospiraceae bacterium]|jgi:hypothetical protein